MHYIATLPETGVAVLLVTHDATIAGFAQKIIHIRDGVLED
jgi:ABC-type lipoprotein export system ATPase subunit